MDTPNHLFSGLSSSTPLRVSWYTFFHCFGSREANGRHAEKITEWPTEVGSMINSLTGKGPASWWLPTVPLTRPLPAGWGPSKCMWFRATGMPTFAQGKWRATKRTVAHQSVGHKAFSARRALNVPREMLRFLPEEVVEACESNTPCVIPSFGPDTGPTSGACSRASAR